MLNSNVSAISKPKCDKSELARLLLGKLLQQVRTRDTISVPLSLLVQELHDLFTGYGAVQECRILHRGDEIRGAGALVRMNSVANATLAILALNGSVPASGLKDFTSLPLMVRFADSPEEKARKQARKEQMAQQPRHTPLTSSPHTYASHTACLRAA